MTFEPSREAQLSEKKLNMGFWWVTHKIQVRRLASVALAVFSVVTLGYGAFGFADWFFGSGVVERQQIGMLTTSQTDFAGIRAKNAPQDLQPGESTALPAGDRTYDISARITNPNARWWADFDYHFTASSVTTPVQHGYVLPGDYSYLSALGTKSDATPDSLALVIDRQTWHRVDQHVTMPDYESWATARLRLSMDQPVFVPPSAADAVAVSRVRFHVTNDTGFGYYKVGFFVAVQSGGRVVGVNHVTISELRPGETREVDASWFADLPSATTIEVKPEVNIFDDRIYIAPGK